MAQADGDALADDLGDAADGHAPLGAGGSLAQQGRGSGGTAGKSRGG